MIPRAFRILWMGARAAGADFGTRVGIGIRMTAGYSIGQGSNVSKLRRRRTVRTLALERLMYVRYADKLE